MFPPKPRWALLVLTVVVACNDDPASNGAAASSSAAPTTTASATASAGGKTPCELLNDAVWAAVAEAPKACIKTEDCVIVGPGSCLVGKEQRSCVAGVAKGYEKPIDVLSKKWEAAGCDKTLKEVEDEKLVCKAGNCTVLFRRR